MVWLGHGEPRDDKVLTATHVTNLLHDEVTVEEKLDGANLGFSINGEYGLRAQNRGQYLTEPFGGQFSRLQDWLNLHSEDLRRNLVANAGDDLMLFGEWCAARHSLNYDNLPDWFLLFDVYERRTKKFWSSRRRNLLAREIGLATVATVFRGQCDLQRISDMLAYEPSHFRQGALEGLVVRRESTEWCEERAKIVRADFTQSIDEHWSRRRIEWNRVRWPAA
jgi:ATP-dependent RNA circularization protein (DNA/RNA ligase family)